MKHKIDMRLILFKVYNMHRLVFECIKENNYEDAYFLLNYELKKYQYILDNLEFKIKISTYYLEYAPTIKNKIKDIEYALEKISKNIQIIPNKLSKDTLLNLYILQLNNIVFYYDQSSLLTQKEKKLIYYIFIYLSKNIKKLDKKFHLNKEESSFLFSISPFKTH